MNRRPILLATLLLPNLAGASFAQANLFFSEYVEGSLENKAVEVYNSSSITVDLSAYRIRLFSNGSPTASTTSALSGMLASGSTAVFRNTSASGAVPGTNLGAINFNGDDAVELSHTATLTVLDVIGQIGVDPGTAWTGGSVSTLNQTLRRKPSICKGDTNGNNAFDPSLEWDSFPIDTFAGLLSHTANCPLLSTICTATSNSNGTPASITATGNSVVSNNDLTLHITGLPLAGTTALVFNSQHATTVIMNPLSGGMSGVPSDGNICIGGGNFGRHYLDIWSGMTGSFDLALDLQDLPYPQAPGDYSAAVLAGQTWYWQCWYRDNALGAGRNNFTDAIGVTFL